MDQNNLIWDDPEKTAVVIATPPETHFNLYKNIFESGKHIFVEKSLAIMPAEVDELEKIADLRSFTIMASNTFIYNTAVRYVRQMIDSGELGDNGCIWSQRLNLALIRTDIEALWNFAPHDISITNSG